MQVKMVELDEELGVDEELDDRDELLLDESTITH